LRRSYSSRNAGSLRTPGAREVSRFARNSRDWQQLIEMCRVVDTLLVDQEAVYAPRQGNDRLLLGLKGSLNEYELDLLRQRSLAARYEKARRGELIVVAPVGYVKTDDQRLEKDPDRRVQEAIERRGGRNLCRSQSGCGQHQCRSHRPYLKETIVVTLAGS
jgi:DNA invertase Pin-like site-specific DNA recombinase